MAAVQRVDRALLQARGKLSLSSPLLLVRWLLLPVHPLVGRSSTRGYLGVSHWWSRWGGGEEGRESGILRSVPMSPVLADTGVRSRCLRLQDGHVGGIFLAWIHAHAIVGEVSGAWSVTAG